jgi:hypothetical protein
MAKTVSFKRLILRAVLRQVSPMVIRLVSVSDHLPLPEFHDVFHPLEGFLGVPVPQDEKHTLASGGLLGYNVSAK